MKLKLPLILLCVCGGLLLGAENLFASQPGFFYANCAGLISQQNLDDDLDARDINNQPIKTQQAQDGLTEIFKSGLFNLLAISEFYTMANILSKLEKTLKLASENLSRNIPDSIKNVAASFLPTTKQLEKILVCLAGVFGFCFLFRGLSLIAYNLQLPSIRLAPVVLRI
jgi:hypothetical protein